MRHPLLITVVIYVAGLGAAGQFAKLAVSFLELARVYDASETQLGLVVSLISLVGVLLGLIAGMVVNRLGTKRALVGGLALGALISFWQAALPDLSLLMLSRVIEGLAHLLIVVAAPTLIAETSASKWRPAALTLWSTFFGVAFALTAVIAPFLITCGGLPALLSAHGVWMAVSALICLLFLPKQGATVSEPLALSSLMGRHARAYATPGIATPAIAWLCYTLTFVSVLTGLPLLTEGTAPAWLAPLAPLVSIAVALTLGVVILSRKPALPVLIGGFALCLVSTALVAVVGFTATTILLLFATMAFVQGSGFAVVPQLNESADARALANGALAQMGNLGNLSGTPILIALYQGAPVYGPVVFLFVAYGVGLVVTWVLGSRAQAARSIG